MLSSEYRRQRRSLLQTPNLTVMLKKSTPGTLSPETTATTSSGYSTGGSSVSNTKESSSKKSSSITRRQQCHQQQQYKTQSKGFHNLLSKLKNFLLPSKTKDKHLRTMRAIASRQISSTNILRQYHQNSTIYDVSPSSLTTSNTISLPFTYYHNSPIQQSKGNFEKISAWLDHTEKVTKTEPDKNCVLFIDSHPSIIMPSSSVKMNQQVVTVVMKNTQPTIRPPKRSSSLVARITQPIIEKQMQRAISPASSFSSSILTKGMSDRIATPSPVEQLNKSTLSKSSRQRTIEVSRRRTIASTSEHNSNKENLSAKHKDQSPQDVYRFSPTVSSSKNKVEIHIPSTKHIVTKEYYFHSYPTETNEDLLNNSYGLTLLKQQAKEPVKSRHSAANVLTVSKVPNKTSSEKQYNPRNYLQKDYTLESLEDLLCDREVESYFYPTSQSDHLYMNYDNSTNSYQLPLAYVHETLC